MFNYTFLLFLTAGRDMYLKGFAFNILISILLLFIISEKNSLLQEQLY